MAELTARPSDFYETPKDIFKLLNDTWGPFTLDVAAEPHTALCESFFTKEDNALEQSWKTSGVAWCNPPYSRGWLAAFTAKAKEEALRGHPSVLLVPHDPSTRWWQENVLMGNGADGLLPRQIGEDLSPGINTLVPRYRFWPLGDRAAHRELHVAVWALPKRVKFCRGGKPVGTAAFPSAAIKYEVV